MKTTGTFIVARHRRKIALHHFAFKKPRPLVAAFFVTLMVSFDKYWIPLGEFTLGWAGADAKGQALLGTFEGRAGGGRDIQAGALGSEGGVMEEKGGKMRRRKRWGSEGEKFDKLGVFGVAFEGVIGEVASSLFIRVRWRDRGLWSLTPLA